MEMNNCNIKKYYKKLRALQHDLYVLIMDTIKFTPDQEKLFNDAINNIRNICYWQNRWYECSEDIFREKYRYAEKQVLIKQNFFDYESELIIDWLNLQIQETGANYIKGMELLYNIEMKHGYTLPPK